MPSRVDREQLQLAMRLVRENQGILQRFLGIAANPAVQAEVVEAAVNDGGNGTSLNVFAWQLRFNEIGAISTSIPFEEPERYVSAYLALRKVYIALDGILEVPHIGSSIWEALESCFLAQMVLSEDLN